MGTVVLRYALHHARSVKMAMIAPLSGPWARQGQLLRMGAEMAIDDINASGGIQKLGVVAGSHGVDIPPFEKLRDFRTWEDEKPPKGMLYNYPPRGDVTALLAGYPAPTSLGTQMFAQGTICNLVAQCTQQGKSIDQAIDFARTELEGFMRT
jgi:hypothetical protein